MLDTSHFCFSQFFFSKASLSRSLKIGLCGIGLKGYWRGHQTSPIVVSLTHYQTTNFRLFKTERACRGQFQIWQKWQKVIQTGRKHCEKRRNCSSRAISPFPTVFSKGLFPRGVKRCLGFFFFFKEANLCIESDVSLDFWICLWSVLWFLNEIRSVLYS